MIAINRIIARGLGRLGYKLVKKPTQKPISDFGNSNHIIAGSLNYYNELQKSYPQMIVNEHDAGLLIEINNIKHYITSSEEIYILNEVYVQLCYDVVIPFDKVTVIDIGMNVGISSLYFANMECVDLVYGFEPVKPTYDQALQTFELNTNIATKVIPQNFGLGNKNRQETFTYNAKYKGSVGKVEATFKQQSEGNINVDVVIKDVFETINDIVLQNKENSIILKIDCEGGEFEIIERLYNTNLLSKMDIVLLEWHMATPEILIEQLLNSGFAIQRNATTPTLGLLYAFKIKPN